MCHSFQGCLGWSSLLQLGVRGEGVKAGLTVGIHSPTTYKRSSVFPSCPLPCIFDTHARTAFFSQHFDSLGVGWSSAGHTDLDSEGIHMENIHPRIFSRGREVMQAWDVTKGIHGDSKQPETGETGSCCHSRLQNRREKDIARSQRGTTALVQISW